MIRLVLGSRARPVCRGRTLLPRKRICPVGWAAPLCGSRATAVQGCAVRRNRGPGPPSKDACSVGPVAVENPASVRRLLRGPGATPIRTLRTGRALAASRWPPKVSFREMEIGRSRRWRRGLRDVHPISSQSRPTSVSVRSGARTTSTSPRRTPGTFGCAADHLGRGRRLFCRCGPGTRHARVPVAEVRRHRIPPWAARAEYFAGDSHVEFI